MGSCACPARSLLPFLRAWIGGWSGQNWHGALWYLASKKGKDFVHLLVLRGHLKTKKKVVTVAHVSGKFGGHSRHLELARGLGSKGWDVVWIAPEGAQSEILGLEGVRYGAASTVPLRIPVLSMVFRTLASLYKFRRDVSGSTLILFSEFDILAHWLAKLFVRPEKAIFMQRSDLIVKTEFLLETEPKPSLRLRLLFLHFIYQKLSGQIDQIIVQTPFHEKRLRQIGVKTPVSIVPNNINTSWITKSVGQHNSPFASERGTRLLLIANLFYRIKGFDLLFESLERLQTNHDFTITIVGGGIDEEIIRREITAKNLDERVKLAGRHPNASTIIPLFDGLLVPSPYDDCPNVVLEAINARIPILATEIDAHRFLLGDDFPLLKVSPESFSSGIMRFLEGSEDYRKSLVPQERREVFEFDWSGEVINEISA